MRDVLIRDIPDDVLAALDVLAARLVISRSEYIRRRLRMTLQSPVCRSRSMTCAVSLRRSPTWLTRR